MHDYGITTAPGTAIDGSPTRVYVLTDLRGEILSHMGWWYTRGEAEAVRERLETRAAPNS